MDGLVRRRTRHDSAALTLGLAPFILIILMWPFFVITGPAAIIYAILRWNTEGSLVDSGKWRLIAAIVLGLAQTILGGLIFFNFMEAPFF